MRRGRGEGGLHWDERRQRWIATVTIGYDAGGRRITRKASGKTKTEAKEKLKGLVRDNDDGLAAPAGSYTVADAVNSWLAYGLSGRNSQTVSMYRIYADTHIIPALGKRTLRQLTVEDVEKLLSDKSASLSTRSLKIIHSILNRAVTHAQARDKVRRNVITLCSVPAGRQGRPSKSLTSKAGRSFLPRRHKAFRPDKDTAGQGCCIFDGLPCAGVQKECEKGPFFPMSSLCHLCQPVSYITP